MAGASSIFRDMEAHIRFCKKGDDILYEFQRNRIYNTECIAGMSLIPDGAVDMILTDLPYGMTNCP